MFLRNTILALLFAKLSPSPSSNCAVAGSIPSFSVRPAVRQAGWPTLLNSTFQAKCGLDLKSKVVYINDETLEIFFDLNPIGHAGHLTLF